MTTFIRRLAAAALGYAMIASTHAAEPVIGMSFPAATHGWMGAVIKNAQDEAQARHVKFQLATAADPARQVQDIDELIAKKPSVVVMLPIEPSTLARAVTKLKAANIPLVLVDRETKSSDYAALVKGDNIGIGVNAAHYIAKELGGKGNVVEIVGVQASVTVQRMKGFRETLLSTYPDLKLVLSRAGDFQRDKSYAVMKDILQAQPHIDAVYTHDDEMALGVLQAVKESGRSDIKLITGAGGSKAVYKLIADGEPMMKATFVYSPLMVKDAVRVAVDIANGKPPAQKDITLPATPITAGNVSKFLDPNANY